MVLVDHLILDWLRHGVEQHPDSQSLRLFLAGTLMQAGEDTEALAVVKAVLAGSPADIQALLLAAFGCEAAGGEAQTSAFRKLLAALEATTLDSERPLGSQEPGRQAAPITAFEVDGVDIDELLDEALTEGKRHEVNLDDVGGLEDVKVRLRTSFLNPMRNPELQKAYAKSLTGGLLLYGPPGCGKTFIAKAIAGELGASFMHIALHDVVEKWFGQSEQNLHRLFQTARTNAPCLVFFDEIDALGYRRSSWDSSSHRSVLSQLLTEMDSAVTTNEGVFFLAATNAPWDVDAALRRPGRFDRTVFVGPPDLNARSAILQTHANGRPVQDVDFDRIANATNEFSGADLKLVVDAATELAMDEAMTSNEICPIENKHFAAALRATRPSIRPWVDMARNQFSDTASLSDDFEELITFLRRQGRRSIGFGG